MIKQKKAFHNGLIILKIKFVVYHRYVNNNSIKQNLYSCILDRHK